ncbi:PHD finger protein 14-like isoform X2 [Mercenaria mercenaria]|uniref:PHD finger protein 14-like isoform X2 n=1 Tax=Mercenaria mercenaria TaxID=6596 RepID=UPI00234F8A80|nr:PHD finger protein 14-like isoform X2 [Mercenaria mercenaria]
MADDSDIDENDKNVGFLYRAMRNRDPGKRRVKPVQKHLIQVNFGGDDSENDSDYQAKNSDLSDDDEQELETDEDNGCDGDDDNDDKKKGDSDNEPISSSKSDLSDDDDCTDDSSGDSSDDEGSDDESDGGQKRTLLDVINTDDDDDDEDYVPRKKQKQIEKHVEKQRIRSPDLVPSDIQEESQCSRPMKVLICCVCLGDISETDDEIVECDNCGVAVHEGCYGISDNQSAASTESSASTEPWFCDACKAGVKPDCELCPNEGGIFKETDAGKWVHLVCALYTPGVAFGDVDKLSPVTLFEMPYSKWGLKECSLCEDSRFSKTGVCVSCDAGMCRSFFHVTCAQRNGLLSEASPDEDIADPFYAYCKLHADKITSRAKRRNFLAIQSHVRQHTAQGIPDEKEKARFKRKLNKHRQRYLIAKAARPPSWVPPQKMVRYLTSSPSAVKKMLRKAELMGIITQSHHVVHTAEKQERKKSHTGPAFSADYVTYYLDRNVKIEKLRADLKELEKQNLKLRKQDNALRQQYDKLLKQTEKPHDPNSKLRKKGEELWSILNTLAGKPMPLPEIFRQKKVNKSPARKEVLKSPSAVINQCGICRKSHDQHLLARCDKCRLWYHLGCLNPPLTRMPKKTSRWGWQCSECADSSSEESEESSSVNVDAPRRLREKIKEPAKFSRAKEDMEFLFPNMHGRRDRKKKMAKKCLKKKPLKQKETSEDGQTESHKQKPEEASVSGPPSPAEIVISDDSSMEVEIKIVEETTPIHRQLTSFHEVSRKGRKIIKKRHYDEEEDDSDTSPKQSATGRKVTPDKDGVKKVPSKPPPHQPTQCVTCSETGSRKTMVQCDSCEQWYHLKCLDPPCTRTPKQRGYTWICEACDVSEDSDDDDNGEEKT